MTSKYYSPVILESFNSRTVGRHQRRHHEKRSRYPRQAVIPLDGPAKHLTVGGRIISGDIAVFEDKAANAVLLEAENQLKSGYPTIATSTMVARRNKVTVPEDIDSTTDVRFFSDLVKPMQYRWKFQKDKLKTITPSKRGFHQRSQSPTYQRLVEAHDKLQSLAESESSEEAGKIDKGMTDFFETQSDLIPPLYVKPSEIFRYTRSDPVSNRTSFANSIPATDVSPVQKPNEIKPEIRTIEPTRKEKDNSKLLQETTAEEVAPRQSPVPKEITSTQEPPKPIQKHHKDFKVDFKKHDSHSELHLFLPHIHDTNTSRGATPEEKQRKHKTQFTLPAIEDLEIKPPEEDKSRLKKKQKPENKKKKKYLNRIKSGKDDKQITDRLNDIPTWISLETNKDYHPESMCVFENCTLHKHKKSTKIRQP